MFGLKYQQALIQKWLKGKYHKRIGNTNFKIIQNFLLTRLKICWILGKLFIFIGGNFVLVVLKSWKRITRDFLWKVCWVEKLIWSDVEGGFCLSTNIWILYFLLKASQIQIFKSYKNIAESLKKLNFFSSFFESFRENFIISEKPKSLLKVIQKSLRNFVDNKRWISNLNCQSNTHIPFTNPFSFLIYEKGWNKELSTKRLRRFPTFRLIEGSIFRELFLLKLRFRFTWLNFPRIVNNDLKLWWKSQHINHIQKSYQ